MYGIGLRLLGMFQRCGDEFGRVLVIWREAA